MGSGAFLIEACRQLSGRLMAAWDWGAEGSFLPGSESPSGIPIDRAQEDDTDQFTFVVARRESEEQLNQTVDKV